MMIANNWIIQATTQMKSNRTFWTSNINCKSMLSMHENWEKLTCKMKFKTKNRKREMAIWPTQRLNLEIKNRFGKREISLKKSSLISDTIMKMQKIKSLSMTTQIFTVIEKIIIRCYCKETMFSIDSTRIQSSIYEDEKSCSNLACKK